MAEKKKDGDVAGDEIDVLVSKWVAEKVHGSPLSRDTSVYNYLVTDAIPALVKALKGD